MILTPLNGVKANSSFLYSASMVFPVRGGGTSWPSDIIGGGSREIAEGLHHALLPLAITRCSTDRLDLDERRTIALGANRLVHYGLEVFQKSSLPQPRAIG